jgi:hypothetical protein
LADRPGYGDCQGDDSLRLMGAIRQLPQATTRAASLTHRLVAFARSAPGGEADQVDILIAGMSDLMRSTSGKQLQVETVKAAGVWMTKADPFKKFVSTKIPGLKQPVPILHGASI